MASVVRTKKQSKPRTRAARNGDGVVAVKDKVTLAVRIETVGATSGVVSLRREFTEADPVVVTIGGGKKQPRGSLWHALRQLSDVDLIGRAAGDPFEHTYELPWGAYDPAKLQTVTGTRMQTLLAIWGLASWTDAVAAMPNTLFVSNAWAKGQVVAVDADKIVLDGNGHAGNHLHVVGKVLAIKRA